MAIDANNHYPVAPLSTQTPNQDAATQAAARATFEEYDNTQISNYQIGLGRNKFMSTLLGLGRGNTGGTWDDLGLTEETTHNYPDIRWKEQPDETYTFTVNGAVASPAATTIVLDSSAGLIPGMILRVVDTNEQLKVLTVPNATSITVERGLGSGLSGGIAAQEIADNAVIRSVGNAFQEGFDSPEAKGAPAEDQFNYFQKFVTTVSETDFDKFTYRTGDMKMLDRFMKQKGVEHMLDVERAAMFGRKSTGTTGGEEYHTMDGIIPFLERGWTDDISGGLTRPTLEEALAEPMKYTNNGDYRKILLCSGKVKAKISDLFENRLQVAKLEEINLTLEKLIVNTGEYYLVEHPYLDAASGYGEHALIVDPSFTKIVYPTGNGGVVRGNVTGKTTFYVNERTSSWARSEGQFVSYLTMKYANSNSGGIIKVV